MTKGWVDNSKDTRGKKVLPYFVDLCSKAGFSLVCDQVRELLKWTAVKLRCRRGRLKETSVSDLLFIIALICVAHLHILLILYVPFNPFQIQIEGSEKV
jgi:hypothetical protein